MVRKKIKWSDFKGNPDTITFRTYYNTSPYAVSAMGIKFKDVLNEQENECFQIRAMFNPDESWKLDEDTILLQHEQLHFDILELHVRRLRKCLQDLIKVEENIDLDKETRAIYGKYDEFSDKYVFETRHGTNIIEQYNWSEKYSMDKR